MFTDTKKEVLIEFIKFCIVGVSNVVINLIVYYIMLYFGASEYIANTFGYFISLINAYIWNVKWVFSKHDTNSKQAILKFFIVYIFSYFLSMFLLFLFVEIVGISKFIVPLINIAITTPINFILNKFWSFRIKDNN